MSHRSARSPHIDRVHNIVIVGKRGIGKSALAHSFVEDLFRTNRPPTVGIDVIIRTVKWKNKTIKVCLYDSAGSETIREILPSYFRKANCIIVTYDTTNRETFLQMDEWFDAIRRFAREDTVCFIVGTKIDLMEERKVTPVEVYEYSRKRDVPAFETSALHEITVNLAFKEILEVLDSHPPRCMPKMLRLLDLPCSPRGNCC